LNGRYSSLYLDIINIYNIKNKKFHFEEKDATQFLVVTTTLVFLTAFSHFSIKKTYFPTGINKIRFALWRSKSLKVSAG